MMKIKNNVVQETLTLIPGPDSKPFSDRLTERIHGYQVKIYTSSGGVPSIPEDEIPMPWDAGFAIEGKSLIIEGGAGASGFGKARVEIPLDGLNGGFQVVVELEFFQSEEGFITVPEVREILDAGWGVFTGESDRLVQASYPHDITNRRRELEKYLREVDANRLPATKAECIRLANTAGDLQVTAFELGDEISEADAAFIDESAKAKVETPDSTEELLSKAIHALTRNEDHHEAKHFLELALARIDGPCPDEDSPYEEELAKRRSTVESIFGKLSSSLEGLTSKRDTDISIEMASQLLMALKNLKEQL